MSSPAREPAQDERYEALERTMQRHQQRQDALIEVLHTAQELFGYLSKDVLRYVAHRLKLPMSRVYGVASFYHFFSVTPRTEHTCEVCLGTSCYVNGGKELLEAAQKETGLRPGGRSEDGSVALETSRCPGTCGGAPVVVYDGKVVGGETVEGVLGRLKGWQS